MRVIRLGIFGKVFIYTLLFLTLAIGITAAVFARQFVTAYEIGRRQQLTDSMRPLVSLLQGRSREEMIELARSFSERNPVYQFHILTTDGDTIYSTMNQEHAPQGSRVFALAVDQNTVLSMRIRIMDTSIYEELVYRTAATLILLFVSGAAGAAFFAQRMTEPIKKLAADTKKMSNLEPVPAPLVRPDEVGQLTGDVHEMYAKLKRTISNLEAEIEREREMEENQRYFFSAASHELKTPIASASALLEGMLENIGDYQDHPKYLRECLRLMSVQSNLISEILEIVRLKDDKIRPDPEALHLQSVVGSVLPDLQILAEAKGQAITVKVPDQLHCDLDRKMFVRVLSNVLTNAIQNTPQGERIEIWSEKIEDRTVRLCILNTNTSIDKGHLSKLFEPFYRLDKARSTAEGHSGLGLAIVKNTLDRMGIPFALENTESGVLFWMDLPIPED
jgi:two-component system, OmpR family, sensor histidine kinase VanS